MRRNARLMAAWSEAPERLGVVAALVLLTEDDFASRPRYLALRATLEPPDDGDRPSAGSCSPT